MGKLTTHVLDTSRGVPAKGMRIDVVRLSVAEPVIKSVVTNDDGRVDLPLLEGKELIIGQYELRFYAGDYLKAHQPQLAEPLFLDIIPIRFGVSAPEQHLHVPLLLSPFGYSTYRGS